MSADLGQRQFFIFTCEKIHMRSRDRVGINKVGLLCAGRVSLLLYHRAHHAVKDYLKNFH